MLRLSVFIEQVAWCNGCAIRLMNKVSLYIEPSYYCDGSSTLPRYVATTARTTQPCIPPGSLNRVPVLSGWGYSGYVTTASWHVTLCSPIWHASSHSSEASCINAICIYFSLP